MRASAAVLENGSSRLTIRPVELDEPRPGEVCVRLVACGVSGRDLDAMDGRVQTSRPFIPGTEAAGFVERVGPDVTSVNPGDAVLIAFAACHDCDACRGGDPRRCQSFNMLNLTGTRPDGSRPFAQDGKSVGGFFFGQSGLATHLVCRVADVIVVDGSQPLELLAPLCGDVLTGAAPFLLNPEQTGAVVIAGADVVGLVAVMLAHAQGRTPIIVYDGSDERRDLALALGTTVVVDEVASLATITRSLIADGASVVVSTSSSPPILTACRDSVAAGGRCYFKSEIAGDDSFLDEGADPQAMVPQLLALHDAGQLLLESLIEFYPFDLVNDAIDALATAAVVKPVVRFPIGGFDQADRALATEAAAPVTPDEVSDDAPEPAPAAPVTITA